MKIRTGIIFGFPLAVLIPAFLVLEIFFFQIERHIIKTSLDHLAATATIQKSRIEEMLQTNYERLINVVGSTRLRRALYSYVAYASDPGYIEVKQILNDATANIPDFKKTVIYDLNGNHMVSMKGWPAAEQVKAERWFARAKKRFVVDILANAQGESSLILAGPIFYEDEVLGVLVIHAPIAMLTLITSDYSGLGETGETLLCRAVDHDQALYLLPGRLRYQAQKMMHEIPRMDDLSYPTVQALHRYEGLLTHWRDYRGQEVFVATRYIREEAWGLLVKMDKAEVLEPVRRLRLLGYAILAGVSILSMLASLLWSAPILTALEKIKIGVESIRAGKKVAPLEIRGSSELALLAQSFDQMAASLDEHQEVNQKLVTELDDQNRALETLLHIISHDLKEPLRAVQFFSTAVADRYGANLDDKARDFLRRAVKASQDMDELLENILRLSRARKIEPSHEAVSGAKLVQRALERLGTKIQASGAQIQIAAPLPEVYVDEVWGVQALYNLISNAIKFTKAGEKPQIEIAAFKQSGSEHSELGFEVSDRGPGVPEEFKERIFMLFQRAVGREVEGTGAGLAIVREIAKRHGGHAWVEPREGGGARFLITFSNRFVPVGKG